MSFSASVDKWCKKSDAKIQRVIRQSTIWLFTEVVMRTPVDEGRLRGNWVISENEPIKDQREVFDTSGQFSVRIFGEFVTGKQRKVMITNSLPYAYAIEMEGHSAQAPNGMMRVSARRFKKYVRDLAKKP